MVCEQGLVVRGQGKGLVVCEQGLVVRGQGLSSRARTRTCGQGLAVRGQGLKAQGQGQGLMVCGLDPSPVHRPVDKDLQIGPRGQGLSLRTTMKSQFLFSKSLSFTFPRLPQLSPFIGHPETE